MDTVRYRHAERGTLTEGALGRVLADACLELGCHEPRLFVSRRNLGDALGWYRSTPREIRLDPRGKDWDTLAHELGHHLVTLTGADVANHGAEWRECYREALLAVTAAAAALGLAPHTGSRVCTKR